jgi:hypothetical protein
MNHTLSSRVTLTFLLLLFKICPAQNLVPNASFETHNSCPTNYGTISMVSDWINASGGSPDYYNSCDTLMGVPNNFGGFQQAHSGDSYIGIVCASMNNPPDFREYIAVRLTSGLEAGGCYLFRMFVNLINASIITTDDISIYFSDTLPVSGSSGPLPFIAQLNNTTGFITDTLNWTMITDTYIASAQEKYLVIGNFKDDNSTTTQATGYGTFDYAYFFVDDVSITALSPSCLTNSANGSMPALATVYPNPVTDRFTVSVNSDDNCEIMLFGADSRLIARSRFNRNLDLDISELENGIYFYTITNENIVLNKGRVIKY